MAYFSTLAALLGVLALAVSASPPEATQAAAAKGSEQHAYFDQLVARPDHVVSYSLRDPRQLAHRKDGGFAASNSRDLVVTYAPSTDSYPRRQDAAKVVIPADGNNLRNQIRLPLNHGTQAFVVTWDAWWGEEFGYRTAGIEDYKAFQLESGERIWTEIRARFRRAMRFPGALALTDVRPYKGSAEHRGSVVNGTKYGSGSLGGLLTNFPIAPNTWTRYWVQLVPTGDNGWWEFSLWLADERRKPVALYEKARIKPNGSGWDRLWLEYNTSTSQLKPGRGELVSYVRNVVVLRLAGDVRPILQSPVPQPASSLKNGPR